MLKASIRTIVVILVISWSFVGSDCNEIINTIGNNQCSGSEVDFLGTWKFIYNAGGIRDICLGETVEFNTNGTAYLTCPGQPTLQRSYTVSSDFILTYTETNVKYCMSGDSTELQLTGLNNNRILVYQKVITSNEKKQKMTYEGEIQLNNSSETIKSNYYNE